jgi:hypothetical protein
VALGVAHASIVGRAVRVVVLAVRVAAAVGVGPLGEGEEGRREEEGRRRER